jgi:hypothetical protein
MDAVADKPLKEQFKVWHFLNKKEYDLNSEEGLKRYKIFKANKKHIEQRNKEVTEFQLGLGPLVDMTWEEIQETILNKQLANEHQEKLRNLEQKSFDEMADELDNEPKVVGDSPDWSKLWQGVRNQGGCGSCWTYGATGMLEAYSQLAGKGNDYLSTQELVDCNTTNYGCGGGWYHNALNYIKQQGIASDRDYPYQARRYACTASRHPRHLRLNSYESCDQIWSRACTQNQVHDVLQRGPYATYVQVTSDFSYYRSGVLNTRCSGSVNHAVIAVQVAQGYVKIRNSWGPGWGEGGYIRLRQDAYNNGSCFSERFAYWAPNL